MTDKPTITITENGPYIVTGSVPLDEQTIGTDADGGSEEWVKTSEYKSSPKMALCRCGESGNKPFCDGTHAKIGFDGREVANRAPYADQANVLHGPRYTLMDQRNLCATARFCDTHQTVWREVEKTDDPEVAAIFVDQIKDCVSGRLRVVDTQTGEVLEPPRAQRISTTQDPEEKCSGPLYVEGGIQLVSADGSDYEVRSRMALCRCGHSGNKPFCDGTHTKIGWSDRD